MSERESIINFYTEYQETKKSSTKDDLIDVLGFLESDTQPIDKGHVYYRLIELEDRYIDTIKRLHGMFQHNVPCIKNFLLVELGYKKDAPMPTMEHE
jgi:hypothetical protein